MTEGSKVAVAKIALFLKGCGFKKIRNNWFLRKEEFLLVIGLQRSQWSEEYYINVGIQLENLEERAPKAYNGDIKFRVIKQEGEKYRDIFVLERELDQILILIKKQAIDVFASLETKEEIKTVLSQNPNRNILTASGRKNLDIPDESSGSTGGKAGAPSKIEIEVRTYDPKRDLEEAREWSATNRSLKRL